MTLGNPVSIVWLELLIIFGAFFLIRCWVRLQKKERLKRILRDGAREYGSASQFLSSSSEITRQVILEEIKIVSLRDYNGSPQIRDAWLFFSHSGVDIYR